MEHTLELLAKVGTIRRTYVLPREHGKIIPNICSLVKHTFTRKPAMSSVPSGLRTSSITIFTVPSPPTPSPGNPLVVRVLNPPDRRHAIQARRQTPPAAQLPKHTVDRSRPFELPRARLDRPRRPAHLRKRQPKSFDESRLLARLHHDPMLLVVPLHPSCQPRAELALTVIYKDQPAVPHSPKLH